LSVEISPTESDKRWLAQRRKARQVTGLGPSNDNRVPLRSWRLGAMKFIELVLLNI